MEVLQVWTEAPSIWSVRHKDRIIGVRIKHKEEGVLVEEMKGVENVGAADDATAQRGGSILSSNI